MGPTQQRDLLRATTRFRFPALLLILTVVFGKFLERVMWCAAKRGALLIARQEIY
jgi:hypothetical protein